MLLDHFSIAGKDRFWDSPVKVVLSALLICLLAPIEINIISEIPVTFQTFIILTLAMILGSTKGFLATGLYLILGAAGLPVFAEGGAGWEKLIGPTGGFLLSFMIAAWIVGRLAEEPRGQRWGWVAAILLLGHLIILLIGFVWLGYVIGFDGIWEMLTPLLPGLGIKIILGTVVVGLVNMIMKALIRRNEHKKLLQ